MTSAEQKTSENDDPETGTNGGSDVPDAERVLEDFIELSRDLTGVAELDRRLASAYVRRLREHECWLGRLDDLLTVYRSIRMRGTMEREWQIAERIMTVEPLGALAKQIIYLWYLSALFQDRFSDGPGVPKPRQGVWRYGSWEEYECGLAWKIMNTHPPMTRGGGEFGDWAKPPRRLTGG